MSGFGLVKTQILNYLTMATLFSVLLGMMSMPLMYSIANGHVVPAILCVVSMSGSLLVILVQVGGIQRSLDAIEVEIQKDAG